MKFEIGAKVPMESGSPKLLSEERVKGWRRMCYDDGDVLWFIDNDQLDNGDNFYVMRFGKGPKTQMFVVTYNWMDEYAVIQAGPFPTVTSAKAVYRLLVSNKS
jgi:hypothetical protein